MTWVQGQTLQKGRYTIIEVLGDGGFGVTYLAFDRNDKTAVVIKIPIQFDRVQLSRIDVDIYYKRLEREEIVLKRLNHQNIVKVLDLFREAEILCLVIEYVKGETLSKYVERKEYLFEDEALDIFRKLAAAMQVVHQNDLLHCDIHPENIMVRDSGEPILIDFGSAKLLQPHSVTVTTTHKINYSSPEQILGGEPKLTWDVYSFAASMYFAVTGKHPLSAGDRTLNNNNGFIPPQKERRELSDWVNQAILNGMELEAEDRSQSFEEWIELLQPPKTDESSPPRKRRKPSTFFLWRSPWVAVGCLSLAFVPTGILLYLGNTTAIAANVAKTVAAFVTVFIFWRSDTDRITPRALFPGCILFLIGGIALLCPVLVPTAITIAHMVGMSIAVEPWVLALSWALFWSSLWTLAGFTFAGAGGEGNYDDDDNSNEWHHLLVLVGGLLGDTMSAYSISERLELKVFLSLFWGIITFSLLIKSDFCFLNLSKLSRKRYLRVQHIRLVIIFLSAFLGLALGCGAGWWFKLSGIKAIFKLELTQALLS
jgi:tRNA A-37 threonylcarbamoyl transferase component Bud32